jgi:GNAT superfamily N-acetyltransferase
MPLKKEDRPGWIFVVGPFLLKMLRINLLGGRILIAYDDNERAVGTICLLEHRKGRYRYDSSANLAVLSKCKRRGVGQNLFSEVLKVAREEGYDFITSCTATTADSSVALHLKMGFVIYQKSFATKPGAYDSYCFIYPLRKFRFMRLWLPRKMIYVLMTSIRRTKQLFNK